MPNGENVVMAEVAFLSFKKMAEGDVCIQVFSLVVAGSLYSHTPTSLFPTARILGSSLACQ